MFEYTNKNDPALIAKTSNYSDNVIPSANSVMARNLFKLGTLYSRDDISLAKLMLSNVNPLLINNSYPSFYSNWLQLMTDVIFAPYEVVITGPDYSKLRAELAKNYLPDVFFMGGNTENLPLMENKVVEGDNYIYVCKNKVCKLPVQSTEQAMILLNSNVN